MSITYHGASLLALFGASAAAAQEPPAQSEATVPASSELSVTDDIVVTAQRRAESVQRTPLAITALRGDTLRARGITDVSALASALPNVNIGVANGIPRINIRGIGGTASQANLEAQVAFHEDGVYVGRPVATTDALFDVERIEVVRGPQGTLYGRNATGGAINVITRDPTDDLSGYAEGTAGNYSLYRFEAAVGGPIAEGLSARIAFQSVDRGGYGRDGLGRDIDDQHSKAVRGKLKWEPSSSFKFILAGEYFYENDAAGSLHYANSGDIDPVNPGRAGATTNRAFVLGGVIAEDRYHDTKSDVPAQFKKDDWAVTGTGEWQLGDDATLTSVTGYRKTKFYNLFDMDATIVPLSRNYQWADGKQFSQELRLGGTAGKFTYVAGLFYYYDDLFFQGRVVRNRQNYDPALSAQDLKTFYQRGRVKTDAYAAFAQVGFELTDWLGLDVGGRYSSESKRNSEEGSVNAAPATFPYPTPPTSAGYAFLTNPAQFFNPNLSPLDPANLPGPLATRPEAKATFRKFTPKVTLRAKPNEDTLIYLTYSEGFRSGGFVPANGAPAFKPELLKDYEGGIKTSLFDRKLQINVAGFYYNYSDLQVTRINPTGGANLVDSAGKAELYGAEASLNASITPDFRLDAQAGWLHARYKVYSSSDSNRPSLGVLDLSGNTIAQAPKWTATGGAEYTVHPSFGDLNFRGQVKYTSKVYFTPFNTDAYSQDGFAIFDAYVNYTHPGEHFYGSVYVENIAKKHAWVAKAGMPVSLGGHVLGTPYAPRTFGIRAGYKW